MENEMSGNRLMLVLLFLVSMVSVVAVIVAAVSLTSSGSDTPDINVNSGPASNGGSSGSSNMPLVINSGSGSSLSGSRIFKVAVGHDWGAHEYIDQKGYVRGFTKDLIHAVCAVGGLDCRTVWDQYISCWDSEPGKHSFGGPGLFNEWYDACAGWVGTVGRMQVFDFSLPYAKAPSVYFWVEKGKSFNTNDITGKNIGFMDGFSTDEKCLARQTAVKGSILPVDGVVHYYERQDAVDGLKKGEVHALFGTTGSFSAFDELQRTGGEMSCAVQGVSMMTAKDNDFNSFWNAAFQKFRDSGKFSQMCKQALEEHGHAGQLSICVDAP